jgi:Cu+-exporting ATPase
MLPTHFAVALPDDRVDAARAWVDGQPPERRACILDKCEDRFVFVAGGDVSVAVSAAAAIHGTEFVADGGASGVVFPALELRLSDIHCCSCIGWLNDLAVECAESELIAVGQAMRSPFDRLVVVPLLTDAESVQAAHDAAVAFTCDKAKKGAALVDATGSACIVAEGIWRVPVSDPADFISSRAQLRERIARQPLNSLVATRAAIVIDPIAFVESPDDLTALKAWCDQRLSGAWADSVVLQTTEPSDASGGEQPCWHLFASNGDALAAAIELFPILADATRCTALEFSLYEIHCCSCIGWLNDLFSAAAADSNNPIAGGKATRAHFDRCFVAGRRDMAPDQVAALHDAAIALICDKATKGAAVVGSTADDLVIANAQRAVRAQPKSDFKALRAALTIVTEEPPQVSVAPAQVGEATAAALSQSSENAAFLATKRSAASPTSPHRADGKAVIILTSTPISPVGANEPHPAAARSSSHRHMYELVVDGMSCASCAGKIETALNKQPWVLSANVNFATCTATVVLDADSGRAAGDAITVIKKLGFEAVPMHSAASPDEPGGEGHAAGDGAGGDSAGQRAAMAALSRQGEIRAIRHRLALAIVFTLPLVAMMIVAMSGHDIAFLDKPAAHNLTYQTVVEFLLSTPVVVYCGKPFFQRAWAGLRQRSMSMDTLVAFGVGGSYIFSVGAAIAQAAVPSCHVTCYFDTAGTLLTFMLLGKFLEAYAKRETGDALLALMSLSPPTAILVDKNTREEYSIPSATVKRGDWVKVLAGSRVPVDGIIVEGSTALDESMLTGEPYPVERHPADSVIGGTMNLTAAVIVEACKVGEDTMLANIFRIIRRAQSTKPSVQRLADKAASVFVPIVVTFAILVYLVWLILGELDAYPASWRGKDEPPAVFAFAFFLATMVIACPCALGLATPTAVMVGTGIGAKCGVLIKTGEGLEKAPVIDCVLFDKTGTLTKGQFRVARREWLNESALVALDEHLRGSSLAAVVAKAEAASTHPIATALKAFCEQPSPATGTATGATAVTKTAFVDTIGQVKITPGGGIAMTFKLVAAESAPQHYLVLGSPQFVATATNISGSARAVPTQLLEDEYRRGRTVIIAVVDGIPAAMFSVEDTVKPEARGALAALRTVGRPAGKSGRRIVMVTGDNAAAANEVAMRVGIKQTDVFAQQSPEDKVKVVEKLQAEGFTVAFVGDGINDSAALAQSHLGVALGAGTEVALDAADVIIVNSHLSDIVTYFDLSATTMRRIRINFGWAVLYNVIALPIASGMLYPAIHRQLPPVVAGIAMVCSSLSVLASSLALKAFKPTPHHTGPEPRETSEALQRRSPGTNGLARQGITSLNTSNELARASGKTGGDSDDDRQPETYVVPVENHRGNERDRLVRHE